MKILLCFNDDSIKRHLKGEEYYIIPDVELSKNDNCLKDKILSTIYSINADDDEFVVFIPPGNTILDSPFLNDLNSLVSEAKKNNLDYIRLQKVGLGVDSEPISQSIFKDSWNIFLSVPYLIKFNVLRNILSDGNIKDILYWQSLNTLSYKGGYYFNASAQPKYDCKLPYWKCELFDIAPIGIKVPCLD